MSKHRSAKWDAALHGFRNDAGEPIEGPQPLNQLDVGEPYTDFEGKNWTIAEKREIATKYGPAVVIRGVR